MVFSPALLLTVTLEAANDKPELHLHAGGQGFWVARMLRNLGVAVTLCAPFGGETGRVLLQLVECEGVTVEAIAVSAANGSYVHDRRGGKRDILAELPSGTLDRHDVDDLYDAALASGLDAGILVLTGQNREQIIPVDSYRRLAGDLRSNGCRVIADLSGAELESALEGGLDLLKVADDELRASPFATGSDDLGSMLDRLQGAGASNVVVSRADKPAFARIGERTLEMQMPRIEPLEHRGGGDSMTAGLAAGVARGLALEDALKLAAAAGAVNVSRHGLGTGRQDDIERIARHVQIRDLAS